MRQINRAWVFLQSRKRKGELGDTDRKGGVTRAMGESVNGGKWERKGVKMAAVILTVRTCPIDSDHGLRGRSKRFHSQ